jgi:hypothetical protein
MYPNDGEIVAIAVQIEAALRGWRVVASQPLGGSVSGMRIEYDPKYPVAKERASALADALKDCRLKVEGPLPSLPTPPQQLPVRLVGNTGSGESTIRLTIGRK